MAIVGIKINKNTFFLPIENLYFLRSRRLSFRLLNFKCIEFQILRRSVNTTNGADRYVSNEIEYVN